VADATEEDRPPLDVAPTDRRGSGRADYQDAHLIALLRGQPFIVDPATPEEDVTPEVQPMGTRLRAARGMVIGLFMGAAMWAAIIFALKCFL
jgi:hypothetical protein